MAAQLRENQSFIRIRYGDDQEAIMNPWCPSMALFASLRKKSDCGEEAVLDLATTEGEVQNLRNKPFNYASECVSARETYILVKVENGLSGPAKYTSLLNNLGDIYPDLQAKLESLSRPSRSRKEGRWAAAYKKDRTLSRLGKRENGQRKRAGSDTKQSS